MNESPFAMAVIGSVRRRRAGTDTRHSVRRVILWINGSGQAKLKGKTGKVQYAACGMRQ